MFRIKSILQGKYLFLRPILYSFINLNFSAHSKCVCLITFCLWEYETEIYRVYVEQCLNTIVYYFEEQALVHKLWGKKLKFLQRLKWEPLSIYLFYFWCVYVEDMKLICQEDIYTHMCTVTPLFTIAKIWKWSKSPTRNDQIKNTCYIYAQWNTTQPLKIRKSCYW